MSSRSAGNSSVWKSVHPVAVSSILLAHVVTAFLFDYHPLLQLGQLLFLILWALQEGLGKTMWITFRFGMLFSILFMIVNPLFASHGGTFLWRGPIVSILGRLDFTLEEMAYSFIGVIRLHTILVLSVMFQRFIDHDRFFFLFAKIAPRFVMTSVMAIRLFPLLSREFARIKEVSRLRGIRPKGGELIHRVRYYSLLLRPLLFSSLEGAWLTAEALYARGFGSGKRSSYHEVPLFPRELMSCMMSLVIVGIVIWGKRFDFASFSFYPTFNWSDPLGDLLFLTGLFVLWMLPIYGLRERRQDLHA
ncbi:hypothetical protein C7R93_02590 [Brevibacillus fortis]|uniref:Energy-coupling factor transporter transmembrane protein EcfT n=2 Tax=Brevibacillus fortis TaxID=2126352 RepID=A0A2P7VK22_9BACL|nr:hypothetical protein C7R93_02590 [Brevibacillus fortis]